MWDNPRLKKHGVGFIESTPGYAQMCELSAYCTSGSTARQLGVNSADNDAASIRRKLYIEALYTCKLPHSCSKVSNTVKVYI